MSDASTEDDVSDVLRSLGLPGIDYTVELALDYPAQQLAIDLYAETDEDLASGVETVRAALESRLGITAPTASELDREIRLHRSA